MRAVVSRGFARVVALSCLLVAVAIAPATVMAQQSRDPAPPAEASAQLDRSAEAAAAGAREREQARGSQTARDRRVASRRAYRGQSPADALALWKSSYPAIEQSGNPLGHAGSATIEHVRGPYAAVIRQRDGTRSLLTATLPIRAADGEPLDLDLQAAATILRPAHPAVAAAISRDASGGVSIGDAGDAVTIAPVDAAGASDVTTTGEGAFFSGVAQDTDELVKATPTGAEIFDQLRSEDAPEQLEWRLDLPAGARVRPDVRGGFAIVRGGETLDTISAPSAQDADGEPVPVDAQLDGDRLVITVVHRGADVAYPITVDPYISRDWCPQDCGSPWDRWTYYMPWGGFDPFFGSGYLGTGYYMRNLYTYTYTPGSWGVWYYPAQGDSYIASAWAAHVSHESPPVGDGTTQSCVFWDITNQGWNTESSQDMRCTQFYGGQGGVSGATSGGNYFRFGEYIRTNPWVTTMNPYADFLGGVTLELHDDHQPADPTLDASAAGRWLRATDVIPINAYDAGLGVAKVGVDYAGWNSNQAYLGACNFNGATCPKAMQVRPPVGNLAEGKHTIAVTTWDVVNNQDYFNLPVQIDTTGPTIGLSGSLYDNQSDVNPPFAELDNSTYDLSIDATDGSTSDPRSGVASIDLTVDGQVPPDGAHHVVPTSCTGDSCSLRDSWSFNTAEYAAGPHTVEVTARDVAGNVTSKALSVWVTGVAGYQPLPDMGDTPDVSQDSTPVSVACDPSAPGVESDCGEADASNPWITSDLAEPSVRSGLPALELNPDATDPTTAQASGRTMPVYGIADNGIYTRTPHTDFFNDSGNLNPLMQAGLRRARLTVPYDLVTRGTSSTATAAEKARLARVVDWSNHIQQLGLVPYVTFDYAQPPGKFVPTTVAGYRHAVSAFLNDPDFKDIHQYGAFNEPNRVFDKTTGDPIVPPDLARQFWNELHALCNAPADPMRRCSAVAGEFIDSKYYSYMKRYINTSGPAPTVWGFHPYTSGAHCTTTSMSNFDSLAEAAGQSKIWISEVGGLTRLSNENSEDESLQNKDADFELRHIATVSDDITRFYYYDWNADPGPNPPHFDSGLVRADGSRRPAYNTFLSFVQGASPSPDPGCTPRA
jgi:hypothetical protein